MSKTVTLRLTEELYKTLKVHAKSENRSLSNYIKTSVLNSIRENELVDEYEMESISNDAELVQRLKKGSEDARNMRGIFVE